MVRVVISDDGIGFDPERLKASDERQGWGLLTMAERAETLGGYFRVDSSAQRGTRVTVGVAR
jgi:signal transduction histidine kinase